MDETYRNKTAKCSSCAVELKGLNVYQLVFGQWGSVLLCTICANHFREGRAVLTGL